MTTGKSVTRNSDTPDLGHVKSGFGKRQLIAPMRTQKNPGRPPIRVSPPLADAEGDPFVFVVMKNLNKEPDSKQPDYELGRAFKDGDTWQQPLKLAGLWVSEINVGKAEPVKGLAGLSSDKATRFTLLPDQELPDGSTGWALLQAVRGDVAFEDDGEPDEFLED